MAASASSSSPPSRAVPAATGGVADLLRSAGGGLGADDDGEAVRQMSEMWDHMNHLMQHDPKAYAAFLREQQFESAKTEAQRALSAQLGDKKGVFPDPGFVLKMHTSSMSLRGAPRRKSFVNVATLSIVHPPMLPGDQPVVDKAGKEHPRARAQAGSATVSMALGHVRSMHDNKGELALVVDVCVHPWAMQQADRDEAFRKGLVTLVVKDVLPELGWKLETDPDTGDATPVEIRAPYKGGMPVPGFKKRVVTMKFLVNEADRPRSKTHADTAPSPLPVAEAEARAKEATGEAIKMAATAAGGDEARTAVRAAEEARATAEAASRTASRMRSPAAFLAQTRAEAQQEEPSLSSLPTSSSASATSARPLISVIDESPSAPTAAEAASSEEQTTSTSNSNDDDDDDDEAAAAGRRPEASSMAASPQPQSSSTGLRVEAEASPGDGCVDLLIQGADELVEGSDLGYRVSGLTLRLRLPGREKRIKVPIPEQLIAEAAGKAGATGLSRTGGRVVRRGDGLLCFRVPVQ